MFTDELKLLLRAGKGGDGIVSYKREKYMPKGGPGGGDGGNGGSVIFQASKDIQSLDHIRYFTLVKAENGNQGGKNCRTGKRGRNRTISVPRGTLIRDSNNNEVICDLIEDKQSIQLCNGGIGGLGNVNFKTPTNQTPNKCTLGTMGEEKEVYLELKMIADVGFIGLPNAGKSTLLKTISSQDIKVGDYPFTTLVPNLSCIEFDDYSRLILADIPGIIKDAHKDKGLGLQFLRHIERTELLTYIIDITEDENHFLLLRNELEKHDPSLVQKPFMILLNKIDQLEAPNQIEKIKQDYLEYTPHVHTISAKENIGVSSYISSLKELAQENGKKY